MFPASALDLRQICGGKIVWMLYFALVIHSVSNEHTFAFTRCV